MYDLTQSHLVSRNQSTWTSCSFMHRDRFWRWDKPTPPSYGTTSSTCPAQTTIMKRSPPFLPLHCHLHPRLPLPNRHCAVSAWSPWTGLRIPSLRARYGNVCKLHSVFFLNVLSLGLCSSPAQRLRLGAGVPRHKPPEPALPALPRWFLPRVEVGFRSWGSTIYRLYIQAYSQSVIKINNVP